MVGIRRQGERKPWMPEDGHDESKRRRRGGRWDRFKKVFGFLFSKRNCFLGAV
jgi:hypothetical protein